VVTINNNSIFVVHGRDGQLNTDMFAFLRAIGLNPLEWSQAIKGAKGANPHIDDVIYDAMEKVQGVLVMFSPDEEARLKSKFCTGLDKKKGFNKLDGQARPNVIFEAGLALGAHSKKNTVGPGGRCTGHQRYCWQTPRSSFQLACQPQRVSTAIKDEAQV
jgi:predicted nucleotide-binding protein